MLSKLSAFFEHAFTDSQESEQEREHALRVATALLMIEVSRADYADSVAELLEEASREADRAVELQQFTRRLHERLSMAEKHRVIEMLWEVAFADERLDKHEDHLVGRLAELLYVPRSDLIRIRNRVRGDR